MTETEFRRKLEATVMRLLLIEQPQPLALEELALEMEHLSASERTIEDAIDRLARAGLVNRRGALTSPSRAARYLHRLEIA